MPINAGAVGIQPVQPQRPTGETEGIQRRQDSTSGGFRPQTQVALKTAITDLAATLAKISSNEKFGFEKLPSDIGQVVRNIMQQAFSIDATLGQSIGSTIESQHFSNDQLMILARMLSQIGALADKGFSMELSDETKTLLAQFKNLIVSESGGNFLEPVLMSKSAFELIDNKNPEQLPQALYEILAQLSQSMTTAAPLNQPQQSEGMQFLNQLIKFFMPRPTADTSTAQNQTQQQNQSAQNQQRPIPTPTQRLLNSMYRQLDDPYANLQKQQAAQQSNQNQQFFQKTPTQQPNQNSQAQNLNQQLNQNSQAQNLNQQPNQNSQAQNLNQQPNQNSQAQNLNQQPNQNSQAQNLNQQPNQNLQPQNQSQQLNQNLQPQNQSQQPNQNLQPQAQSFLREGTPVPDENFLSKQQILKNQMQDAKNILLKQPMQNNQQTMDTLKSLAQLLMRNSQNLTPRETTLLQNFVNNTQKMFPEAEARHLQNLLRLCQQNVPAVVQQAAVQHKLPDLPRLWAFMQLCDMANLPSQMSPRAFKKAGRAVSDFANIMRGFMGSDNTTVQNQRSFQMMLPLYLGENLTSYPTYLSVYDENAKDPDTGVEKKETWLRICVLTDNIGAAELIFRVYEGNQLDMRFYFSEADAAEDFRSYVSNLRDSIRDTKFNIGEIRIGSVGERMLAS